MALWGLDKQLEEREVGSVNQLGELEREEGKSDEGVALVARKEWKSLPHSQSCLTNSRSASFLKMLKDEI